MEEGDRRDRLAASPRPLPHPGWSFPDPDAADEDGVVGIGADLEPATLVAAYRRGIFPWPHPGLPLPWFSPDPRAILTADSLHVSRSLRRTMARSGWTTTADRAFGDVVAGCADRPAGEGTWITADMRAAYGRLHRLGWAHSVEVWRGDDLVGGIYGVQVGGCFTGESMFHRVADASKVALVALLDRFAEAGGSFLDVQLPTPHLVGTGARELPRRQFLDHLADVRDDPVRLSLEERAVARLAQWTLR
ncbi:MAG: leucyl/phenylalanyl-tRNA--protein transferase [Nitriliruptorales bacterium]